MLEPVYKFDEKSYRARMFENVSRLLKYDSIFLSTNIYNIARKMVPITWQAKVKLFDVHALCRFDVSKASFL